MTFILFGGLMIEFGGVPLHKPRTTGIKAMTHADGIIISPCCLMKISLMLVALAMLFALASCYSAPSHCSEDDQIDCIDDIRACTTAD